MNSPYTGSRWRVGVGPGLPAARAACCQARAARCLSCPLPRCPLPSLSCPWLCLVNGFSSGQLGLSSGRAVVVDTTSWWLARGGVGTTSEASSILACDGGAAAASSMSRTRGGGASTVVPRRWCLDGGASTWLWVSSRGRQRTRRLFTNSRTVIQIAKKWSKVTFPLITK